MIKTTLKPRGLTAIVVVFCIVAGPLLVDVSGQRSRTTTRSTSSSSGQSRTTTTRTTRTQTSGTYNNRGTVVHGEEGYAAVGRRGAVAVGEEGAAAVTRRGAAVVTEEGAAAVGRYGNVVVAGEEGYAAGRRYGGVYVGHSYETYEAWRVVAGTAAVIAIGTMLARPPASSTTVVVTGTTYWVYQNTYYSRVYVNGAVVYQVVAKPM